MILRNLALTTLALFVIAAPVQAAKGKKTKKGAGSSRVLARFDRDHNGVIDGQEIAHMQAVYVALFALDTDKNGVLTDAEIAVAKIPMSKRGAKKTSTTPATTPPAPAKTPEKTQ